MSVFKEFQTTPNTTAACHYMLSLGWLIYLETRDEIVWYHTYEKPSGRYTEWY